MPKSLIAITASLVLFAAGAYGAVAQSDLTGSFAPFIVDVQQAAPIEVSVAVPIEGGEPVTVTVPMTVNVALRVSVEGPNVVSVEPLAEKSPEITVSEPVASEIKVSELTPDSQLVDAAGVPYTAEAPAGLEVSQAQSTTRYGNVAVIGEVKNMGDSPVKYAQAVVTLYDSDGNMLAVESTYLDVKTLEPGHSSPFAATFSDDVSGAARFAVRIEAD